MPRQAGYRHPEPCEGPKVNGGERTLPLGSFARLRMTEKKGRGGLGPTSICFLFRRLVERSELLQQGLDFRGVDRDVEARIQPERRRRQRHAGRFG